MNTILLFIIALCQVLLLAGKIINTYDKHKL